ncbi:MAG: hypothetical protein NW226_08305 [Microscillaceae bacterium]|nr:hypothetical protein [Microscillaceae bacterium]
MQSKFMYYTLIFICTLFSPFFLQAQNCVMYFPAQEGNEMELTNYDAKNKVSGVVHHKILSKSVSGSNVTIKASFENYKDEKKEELITSGDYEVKCENGVFKFQFGTLSLPQSGGGMPEGMKMELTGDFIEIPSNPQPGQTLNGGTMNLKGTMEGNPLGFKMSATMSNRKVEGKESVTTKAGTFECFKFTYDVETKVLIKFQSKVTEWYSPEVGLVKSESYSNKGKLVGRTELTMIKR